MHLNALHSWKTRQYFYLFNFYSEVGKQSRQHLTFCCDVRTEYVTVSTCKLTERRKNASKRSAKSLDICNTDVTAIPEIKYVLWEINTFNLTRLQKRKHSSKFQKSERKGKSVLVEAWTGLQGSRTLRHQGYLTIGTWRLSVLSTGRLYPPGKIPGTEFCRGWDNPRATVRQEGFSEKTRRPATFQFDAQCMNQLQHSVHPGPNIQQVEFLYHKASSVA